MKLTVVIGVFLGVLVLACSSAEPVPPVTQSQPVIVTQLTTPVPTPIQVPVVKDNHAKAKRHSQTKRPATVSANSAIRDYYAVPEIDPEWNQGVYLPRHCRFWGEYEGVSYDETPVQEVPFKAEHKKKF